jgi:hypothetical protein
MLQETNSIRLMTTILLIFGISFQTDPLPHFSMVGL